MSGRFGSCETSVGMRCCVPKDTLREWVLIDDDDLADAHLHVDNTDEAVTVEPVQ